MNRKQLETLINLHKSMKEVARESLKNQSTLSDRLAEIGIVDIVKTSYKLYNLILFQNELLEINEVYNIDCLNLPFNHETVLLLTDKLSKNKNEGSETLIESLRNIDTENSLDDLDNSLWQTMSLINELGNINFDFNKVEHSSLLIEIRDMIHNKLEEIKQDINE